MACVRARAGVCCRRLSSEPSRGIHVLKHAVSEFAYVPAPAHSYAHRAGEAARLSGSRFGGWGLCFERDFGACISPSPLFGPVKPTSSGRSGAQVAHGHMCADPSNLCCVPDRPGESRPCPAPLAANRGRTRSRGEGATLKVNHPQRTRPTASRRTRRVLRQIQLRVAVFHFPQGR